MHQQMVIDLLKELLLQTLWLSLPILAVGFVAGVVVSILQILTSIQDPAFGAVPRLLAFFAGLVFLLPWMLMRLTSYTSVLLGDFSKFTR